MMIFYWGYWKPEMNESHLPNSIVMKKVYDFNFGLSLRRTLAPTVPPKSNFWEAQRIGLAASEIWERKQKSISFPCFSTATITIRCHLTSQPSYRSMDPFYDRVPAWRLAHNPADSWTPNRELYFKQSIVLRVSASEKHCTLCSLIVSESWSSVELMLDFSLTGHCANRAEGIPQAFRHCG